MRKPISPKEAAKTFLDARQPNIDAAIATVNDILKASDPTRQLIVDWDQGEILSALDEYERRALIRAFHDAGYGVEARPGHSDQRSSEDYPGGMKFQPWGRLSNHQPKGDERHG